MIGFPQRFYGPSLLRRGNIQMVDQYTVEQGIRSHYRRTYEGKAEKVLPWRTKFSRGLFAGGIFTLIGGGLGMAAAGVMAFFSLPFVLPVLIGSAALIPVGALGFPSSKKLYRRIERTGGELMEADITNLTLVKSYVTDVLPGKTMALQSEREREVKSYEGRLKKMDEQDGFLKDHRRAALLIIRRGMDLLERNVAASQKELDFFQKEAEETLGADFTATARKQRPPTGAGPIAVNAGGPGPAPLKNTN